MPTEAEYLRGAVGPIPERIELQAGPLQMCFEPEIGFLRYIRLGDAEILRGIYSAVRDHNWDTIAPEITNLEVETTDASFEIRFDVSHIERDIDFRWKGAIVGTQEGCVTFSMDGEAHSTFRRNRVGFCVLHAPSSVAGQPCTVIKDDGSQVDGRFPDTISPHQPFMDMREIHHEVRPGVMAEIRFQGDVFEMEDQRNWTDASYKTYCTPLGLPFPVTVEKGGKVSQSVTVKIVGDASESSPVAADVVLNVNTASKKPMPAVGLSVSSHGEALDEDLLRELQALNLAHIRVDLRLAEPGWEGIFDRGVNEASALGAELEVAAYVSDAASAELDALAAAVQSRHVSVCRVLLFHVAEIAADRKWVDLAREKLDLPVVSGANAYFTELNRNRPEFEALDGVCYSLNPQVHAFDDASLMETLIAQGWTVDSARAMSGNLPVHVSPVTLSPRFNPNATGPDSEPEPGTLPSSVDARQMSLLGAAWTVGSLKYLAASGATSATYFETTGWKGVLPHPAATADVFPAEGAFPMSHVFAWFGGMRGGSILVTDTTDSLRVDALALERDGWVRILIANTTPKSQSARVNCPGLAGLVRVETLDEETVEMAVESPRRFRSRKDIENMETSGGSFRVDLEPYSVLCVKGQLAD